MNIVLFLISTSIVFAPGSDLPQAEPMSMEAARSRLAISIDDAVDYDERMDSLADIIERCADSDLVGSAHYQRGLLLMTQFSMAGFNGESAPLALAIDEFLAADMHAESVQLRSRARYNIGHAHFMSYQQSAENIDPESMTDLDSMISILQEQRSTLVLSAGAFRSVWAIDPSFDDATQNLERVRLLIQTIDTQIQQLEDMKKKQQEQNEQKQKDQQDAADKLDELADQQRQEANESSRSSDDPEKKQEQQKQQKTDQDEICDQTNESQTEMSENGVSDEEVESLIEEAKEAQTKAQEKLSEGDLEGAAQYQQEAADKLEEASKVMQELADQTAKENEGEKGEGKKGEDDESDNKEPTATEEQSEGEEKDGDPSEQINEAAKDLLDKERREREARRRYRAKVKPVPVERDW